MDGSKKLIVRLGILLVGVLLFLTFFSNTIHNLNLPSVTVDFPGDGVIKRTARGEGIVEFTENDFIYTDNAGKIALMVKAGDTVSAGDELYTIVSDMDDLHDSLQEAVNNLEKTNLRREKAVADRDYVRNQLLNLTPDDMQESEIDPPDTDQYDYDMERLSREIEKAEEEYDSLQVLYDIGAATRSELDELRSKIDSQELEYRQLSEQRQKVLDDYERAIAKATEEGQKNRDDLQKSFESRKSELAKSIDDLNYQLKEYELDGNAIRLAMDQLNEQIAAGGSITVRAERGGMIREIPDGVESGAFVNANGLIMKIGVTESVLKTVVSLPENTDYVYVGQNVPVNIKSLRQFNMPGTVSRIFHDNGRLNAEIEFTAGDVTGGETADTIIEDVSPLYDSVLPNKAVRKDEYGYYILYAERVKSTLGYEYYAKKMPIHIIAQDDSSTAYVMYTDSEVPIIINSDKPVSDGDRVRLVGGSELVEIR